VKRAKDSCCSYCGRPFDHLPWPRTCPGCGEVSYQNPIPVAVVLLPVDEGLLAIRRSIEPGKGKLALPGGYIGLGETWQEAGAREVREETLLEVDPGEIDDFLVRSTPDRRLVIVFGLSRRRRLSRELAPFRATDETAERVVIAGPVELAFGLHTEAVARWFAR
jgi:ADP-ribose pyrophosphatase YjhB (NUDIX family)